MRRWAWAVFAAGWLAQPALAAPKPGDWGAGLTLGDPTVGGVKYFLSPRQAVALGIGVSQDFNVIGDYLLHDWDLLPQPKRGDLGLYGGVGGRLEMKAYNNMVIRTMAGLSYWPRFKRRDFEFFAELGPAYRIAPDLHWRLDGGFGLRVYFPAR